jgi:serine/threonine protein kinase
LIVPLFLFLFHNNNSDLSPENVMIDQQRSGVIIDMGMCLRVPYQVYQEPLQPGSRVQVVDLKTAIRMGTTPIPSLTTTMPTTTTTTMPLTTTTTIPPTSTTTTSPVNTNLVRRRCLLLPQGTCGKMPYMCPEIYRNRDTFDGEAADIWTAGTILFCMITGNRSYQRPHNTDPQFYWMTNGIEQLLNDWNVTMSIDGIHLLKNMLQINPRQRLTLNEVVNHPWFTYPDEIPIVDDTILSDSMELDLDISDDDD